ncbi:hypothetical protein BC830DRAFT_1151101 [Chytriomyces sp. MP71]|nr:hypothetical protein BC830DRAFT_1151101 [Chytriomyces sp. MP71]
MSPSVTTESGSGRPFATFAEATSVRLFGSSPIASTSSLTNFALVRMRSSTRISRCSNTFNWPRPFARCDVPPSAASESACKAAGSNARRLARAEAKSRRFLAIAASEWLW